MTRYEVCKETKYMKFKKNLNMFEFLFFLQNSLKKEKENFSVQRLHYYWKVLAGRIGKYTVENDFSGSQCLQWKLFRNKILYLFLVFFFSTNGTEYCTLRQRIKAVSLKKEEGGGANSSLAWTERPPVKLMHLGGFQSSYRWKHLCPFSVKK